MGPVDRVDGKNPQLAAEYAEEIFINCRKMESETQPSADYMSEMQTDIHEKMRAILVDWLVDVHYKFKLVPETLYLTINLIDRYLQKEPVTR